MSTTSATTNVDDARNGLILVTVRDNPVEPRLAPDEDCSLPPLELPADVLAEVRKIAQEIFPGKCEFTSEFDPEYPEGRYVVVNVEATGSLKEIVDRECVWDERMRQFRPDLWDTLRLSVMPR